MQSRCEYNPFHNALDTSKKPSIKPGYNFSQSGNEDKRRGKNLNYLYTFFLVAASVHVVGRNDNQKTKITNENSYLTLQLEFAYSSKKKLEKRALALYHTDRKVTRIDE